MVYIDRVCIQRYIINAINATLVSELFSYGAFGYYDLQEMKPIEGSGTIYEWIFDRVAQVKAVRLSLYMAMHSRDTHEG